MHYGSKVSFIMRLIVYYKFNLKILNRQMGQDATGCCERGNKLDEELIIAMKKMKQPQQNGNPPKKSFYDSRLLLTSKPQQIFKCQKVSQPIHNMYVEHTLALLSPLKIPHQYQKGTLLPDYYKIDNTGVVYCGEWKNNLPHGYGVNFYPNQNYYEGTFLQGIPHGFGRFANANGDFYQGQIKFGRANGYGIYQSKQKQLSYRGNFKDNQKHGKGVEKTPQSYFQGTFQYDEKSQGLLKYSDSSYEGTFQDNTFNGKGKLTNNKGVYFGAFKNGVQHGYGQYSWKDGSIYRGYFKKGEREGEGEYYNSKNGSIARGFWKGGLLNGSGEYLEPRGTKYKCIWEDSKIKSIIQ